MTDDLTAEDMQALESIGYSGSVPEDKKTVHSFLHNVAVAKDTTKLGNLNEDELGLPKLPLRTFKELAIFCDQVADMPHWKEYFDKMSENLTASSLSRNAKLLELAVVQRREVADVTKKPRKENKGWFKSKDKSD